MFLRQVWRFMLPSKVMPCFPVFEDNQGAVQLACAEPDHELKFKAH